ncbi:MAG: Ribosomal small subunit methyltransferase [Candidatus Levybacteria bacterium]|nr:Ribosomal small subunit methyltransferase [Candidatus Levybacteria bacterium]
MRVYFTLGGGGHSFEILRLGGIVLGIDVDKEALEFVEKLKTQNSKLKPENLTLAGGNFRDIDKIALLNNFNKVAGIIFDLGVSSHQIDSPARGFSFQNEGPLDMRMDEDLGVRALDLIKILTKGELNEIFTKLGEESRAWEISDAIVRARNVKPIETTTDLAKIVFATAGQSKRVFQALRIVVNDELNALTQALPKAVELLEGNGRLCVISFHSLEDRIVKRQFLEFAERKMGKIITEKPIVPTSAEIERNKRAGSAKLRIFEKLP